MRFKEYTATPQAIAEARNAGVCGDVAKRLARMARRAAPFTGDYANRRFNEFGLLVEGDAIVGVSLIPLETAHS